VDSILELQHLSKRYGDHVAVDDLSFSVPRGSVFGLLGPNGAGKTTTIRMIMRIIASDSGAVLLDGEPVDDDRRRIIGYLPEERGLYKKMKVNAPQPGSTASTSTSGRPTRSRICLKECSRSSSSSAPSSIARSS